MSNYIVVTTIHGLTSAVRAWAALDGWHVVLVGDRKTPPMKRDAHPNVTYLSIAEQAGLGFQCESLLPLDHYSRKNVGYLHAMREGATRIVDTDDDNRPHAAWLEMMSLGDTATMVTRAKFYNAYSWFSGELVWPRGFPLARVGAPAASHFHEASTERVAITQGLADGDPDVDAIWRLLFPRSLYFDRRPPIMLGQGVYCPINYKNTLFEREALPLL